MKKIIIFILISIIGSSVYSQYNCSDSVLLNTGYNHSSNSLYAYGSIDPYWQVVQMPAVAVSSTTCLNVLGTTCPTVSVPSVSYVVNDLTSTVLLNSQAISFQTTNSLACNNCSSENPITFERQFCLKNQDNVTISGIAHYDDMLCVFIDNIYVPITIAKYKACSSCPFSSNLLLTTATSCDSFDPLTNVNRFYGNHFSLTLPLLAGIHNVQLKLRNLGGVLCSVKMEGSIKSATGKVNNFECPDICKNSILSIKKLIDVNCNGIIDSNDTTSRTWTFNVTMPDGSSKTLTTDQYGYTYLNNLPVSGTITFTEIVKPGFSLVSASGASIIGSNSFQLVLNNSNLYEIIILNSSCNKPPPCTCGNWGSSAYTIGNNHPNKLNCNNPTTLILTANKGESFTFTPNYICIGTNGTQCLTTYKYDIYYPGGTSLLNQTSLAAFKLDSCGINRIVMTPYCNGVACPPCEFTINVNCCHCNQLLTSIIYGPLSTGKDSAILACGQTYTNLLDCFKEYIIKVKNPCGETCQPDEVVTTITYPNGTSAVSHSVLGVPLSIGTDIGNYEVLIQVKCNGVWCKECKIIFKQTKACQPPCDNCKNQDRSSKVQAVFNSGGSSVAIQNYPLASTLNAIILLGGGSDTYTQVRVNVVDIQVSSDNPACLQCYNNPNQWGSIISGTCSIPSFIGTSTTYGTIPTTTPYNNSREIVFNNSTATAIPMGTALNLNIQIPGISTLSCCCLKVKVFVKITYRNNKCEECSKTVLIDFTECPGAGNPATGQGGGGTATFNQLGHPQYRIASPNKDAGIPVNFNNKPSN